MPFCFTTQTRESVIRSTPQGQVFTYWWNRSEHEECMAFYLFWMLAALVLRTTQKKVWAINQTVKSNKVFAYAKYANMTHGLGDRFCPPLSSIREIWEIFLFVFCSLVIINQQQQHLLLRCTYPSKCSARSEMMISARWKMGDDFEFLSFFLILKCCSRPVALTYLSFNHHYWSLWNTDVFSVFSSEARYLGFQFRHA